MAHKIPPEFSLSENGRMYRNKTGREGEFLRARVV
jgi:hypothetical protein